MRGRPGDSDSGLGTSALIRALVTMGLRQKGRQPSKGHATGEASLYSEINEAALGQGDSQILGAALCYGCDGNVLTKRVK